MKTIWIVDDESPEDIQLIGTIGRGYASAPAMRFGGHAGLEFARIWGGLEAEIDRRQDVCDLVWKQAVNRIVMSGSVTRIDAETMEAFGFGATNRVYAAIVRFRRTAASPPPFAEERVRAVVRRQADPIWEAFVSGHLAKPNECIVLFNEKRGTPHGEALADERLQRSLRGMADALGRECSFGVSLSGSGIACLPELYEQASDALLQRFWQDGESVCFYSRYLPLVDRPASCEWLNGLTDTRKSHREKELIRWIRRRFAPDGLRNMTGSSMKRLFRRVAHSLDMAGGESSGGSERKDEIEGIDRFETADELSGYLLEKACRLAIEGRPGTDGTGSLESIVASIRADIDRHCGEQINLSFFAKKYSVNASYLSKQFKNVTGHNLSAYLSRVRLSKAKALLKTTSGSISWIAECCGYEDTHYFSRMFKKGTGMTPSEYRNSQASE
ncbi:helix-turn-helix domain-containing protein [Paenibacillus flagellatus]|uniref:HTH araC/xylS-type domain-containing protein n=1 Tax=Paenibacillus flagellatus TaxID=2211139 RepID=A0A2V5KAL2_9BACL|nr:helix-turn-helix domain-containing protein [Paenibacillus flagellatus]PYI56621.1 hypothetical protein DLM86_06540 [Paenibacillus flagellatus]